MYTASQVKGGVTAPEVFRRRDKIRKAPNPRSTHYKSTDKHGSYRYYKQK